jgi:tripartite-type tricarboxylate transporter receptor subunit TctC
MAEAGYPGFEAYTPGVGVVAPAGTPTPIIRRLNEVIRESLARPETRERLRAQGAMSVGGSTPEEFRAWLQQDAERWSRIVKAAGVKAD